MKKRKKSLDLKKPVERPRMPLFVLGRMFVIGSVAVVAAGYALYRHYFVPRPSMLMPVPTQGATEPSAPDLLPVPELVVVPSSAPSSSSR